MSNNPIVRLVVAIIVLWVIIWALCLTSEGGGYKFMETGQQIKEALTPGRGAMPGSNDAAKGSAMPGA